jgi:tetratricopeptide (TPR) repeat protein
MVAVLILTLVQVGFSQLDDLEPLGMEEVPCQPENLATMYDKFASDSLDQQQVGIWYSLAREEFKYNNFKRAIPYYWKVLVNDNTGKFKIVYQKLTQCYYSLEQPDSVLIVCYRGLEKYPDNVTLHYYAGLVHDLKGQSNCAIPHYEAMVEAKPDEKSYWTKLAYLYYQVGDEKAIQAQEQVVELDPKDVEASRLLAEIMEKFGYDPLKARERAYRNDPKNIENAMSYGKAAFERGLYKEAISPFEDILKQEPKNIIAMEYLGRCYESLNQMGKALNYYREILQIEPRNVNVLCLTASVYGRLHEFKTARKYVQNAERVDRRNGLPNVIMAEVYENAVTYCMDKRTENKLEYDDKLVYSYAVDELKKATKDPNVATEAQRRIRQFEAALLLPSTEDKFMHKNRSKTNDACYSWINE